MCHARIRAAPSYDDAAAAKRMVVRHSHNGTGLVAGNPTAARSRTDSDPVLPSLQVVIGFIGYQNLGGVGLGGIGSQTPAWQRDRFAGTLAPTFGPTIAGSRPPRIPIRSQDEGGAPAAGGRGDVMLAAAAVTNLARSDNGFPRQRRGRRAGAAACHEVQRPSVARKSCILIAAVNGNAMAGRVEGARDLAAERRDLL